MDKIMIQYNDSVVLLQFKERKNIKLIYKVRETDVIISSSTIKEIKKLANTIVLSSSCSILWSFHSLSQLLTIVCSFASLTSQSSIRLGCWLTQICYRSRFCMSNFICQARILLPLYLIERVLIKNGIGLY